MKVPFVDLKRQYLQIKPEVDQAIQQRLERAEFVGGDIIHEFEQAFAEFIGAKHCIACGNGTDSIEILLRAFGIGVGDEVIVPAHTWITASETVSFVGAKPVFADVEPLTYTIDPLRIVELINKNTKAIIVVHLAGCPAKMDEILNIAKEYNLMVIEDVAQAHNSEYLGQKTGSIGHAGSFSFYPSKNLGAYGDAGAMVTDDPEIAERARALANHGQLEKHNHILEGRNSRMDPIQSAVLLVKLKYLNQWTNSRIRLATHYADLLGGLDVQLPVVPSYAKHVFHLYMIQLEKRNEVKSYLDKSGITTNIHYPVALPFLKPYAGNNHQGEFPVARSAQDRLLSLPLFPELTDDELGYVCQVLKEALI
ncbi:MAG: DegT/DnrJ/EryC1/StrS family aminotransferase [Bacteroidota bacterium]